MKRCGMFALLFLTLTIVERSLAVDPQPVRLGSVDFLDLNQAGAVLQPIQVAAPLEEVLAHYGATDATDDAVLPAFLEAVIDLADEGLRGDDEVVVGNTDLQSSFGAQGELISETLEISGMLGDSTADFSLTSHADGELRFDLTIFDQQGQATYYEYSLQIFSPPSESDYVAALPGHCKCSKDGVTGCTQAKCEDGDTCPGQNGESCGFYTRSVIVSTTAPEGGGS